MIKKGLSRIGTFFLYLVSLLPFWLLYLVADFLYIILYYITGYRRKVVEENLRNSFPKKSAAERAGIEKKYYRYMADLMVETVKSVSISKKELMRRMKPLHADLLEHYFSNGKSVLAVTAHYGNWEMACLGFGYTTDKRRLVVYKPQSNEVFTDFFNRTRSRSGVTMVSMRQTLRKMIEYKNEPTVTILASDQTPARGDAKYFTTFLHQPTAVFLGVEKLAAVTDCAIVFYRVDRVKRGYYTLSVVPLIEDPKQTKPHEITETHVRYLENLINEKPEYWLWSHRRWKIKPEDVNQ